MYKRLRASCVLSAFGFLCLALAKAQQAVPVAVPTFEVASVKPAGPQSSNVISRMSGGPGTTDPERFISNVTLKTLLLRAFALKDYQITGPGWLDSETYEIRANVPRGATTEQFNEMLRNLLAERFSLVFHQQMNTLPVYELLVGKNGSKLKGMDVSLRSAADPALPSTPLGVPDKDGFLQIPLGTSLKLCTTRDGITRCTFRGQPLSELVVLLEDEFTRPVVNRTGLTGKFDFNLAYSRVGLRPRARAREEALNATPVDAPSDGGSSLLDAVQIQLGLRLDSKKDPIEVLVLDHVDKIPTGNQ